MASNCVATPANSTRSTTAPAMPKQNDFRADARIDARGRKPDHDGVVAGEREIDDDDLRERDQLL